LQDGFTAAAKDVNFSTPDDITINGFAMVLSGVDAQDLGNDINFTDNGNGSLTFNAGGSITNGGQIVGHNLSLTSGGSLKQYQRSDRSYRSACS